MSGVWRRVLIRHAAIAVVASAVVLLAATAGAWRTGRQQTGRDATQVSRAVADAVLADLAEYDFARPAGYDRAAILARLEPFLRSGTLYRIKLWIVDGDDRARIVVSDVAGLEGTVRGRDKEPLRSIGTGGLRSRDVPGDSEHRYESSRRRGLQESFLDFRDAGGHVMSLEAYVPVSAGDLAVQAAEAQVPPLLAGVLALAVATVPLSLAAARRARRLSALATTAADRERRELAQRLHDGPIQQLAAANVVLSVDQATPLARDLLRDSIRELRTLTDDVLPAAVTVADLPALLRRVVPEPIALEVRVDRAPRLAAEHARLVTRSARELVRNAVRHGNPAVVTVSLDIGGSVRLVVRDDGAGFDPGRAAEAGHVGLALIAQAAAEAGGTLTVESGPGAGCTATVELPQRPMWT
ncbi:sensor histidine kinase [Dactylosporangium sp. CS-033363]|uniref:sensor histidine kinase n=1 Tax=Dactylosporangium sp. CS-033363 TaxID=3239935 RepID=UPI003D90EEDC